MAHLPRVFTIPASQPFLPTLLKALAEGRLIPGFSPGHDPLALSRATLYLPTRRACRLAREAFLDVLETDAAMLPRILAIGDIDEDEIVFAEAATGASAAPALDLPPALGGLNRRMLLARLVLKWAASPRVRGSEGAPLVVHSPAAALALADDLARLMDDMTTREVEWGKLDGLVPDNFDEYWQRTLAFLKIARDMWPAILAERGAIEPAKRRDLLINAEAARLAAANDGPVIAAGSTGSMPATAKLLATIAGLPHGAVVLPGLDTDLDEEAWALLGERDDGRAPAASHPQFSMHALLKRIGIARTDVTALAAPHGREALVCEAMRPAGATERWLTQLNEKIYMQKRDAGMIGLSVIEAANAEEEALSIAAALREAAEDKSKTAALVTPDRALARRVIAALGRWNIAADDSAGNALPDTAAGVFARLAAEASLGGLSPVNLLALIKHPLFRLGADAGAHAAAASALERAVLRGSAPRPGSAALMHALASFHAELAKMRRGEKTDLHPAEPRCRLDDADLATAADFVTRLAQALAPLEGADLHKPHFFRAMAESHRAVIEALSAGADGTIAAYAGADGEALSLAFDDIVSQPADSDLAIAPADYPEMFKTVISGRVVHGPELASSRVRIYGPLEARLTSADRVVLGSLVEGVWPPEAKTDPWLSRPMRLSLGLDLPERRIGLSAHDFAQMLGAKEVILTRSLKLAGAPTVASRFLQRLAAVAGEQRWSEARARGENYLAWTKSLDEPAQVRPVKRPRPTPPRAARPTQLSVTEIEHWLRDPYTIYAKHILKLDRLDPVDMPLSAAERGSAIHGAIGEFTQKFPKNIPADALAELLRIGRTHFAPIEDYPEARAFWWPRFEKIARWFVNWESGRREHIAATLAEIRGQISFQLGERTFTLSARADRIERLADGRYAILDYKTGAAPTGRQVRAGVAPQLTLEAAILRGGGFADKGIPAGVSVGELVYVHLKGGEDGGEAKPIDFEDKTTDGAADHALARLKNLALKFEDEATPYRSLVLSMWKTRYGAYDDLARVKEWSLTGGADEGDEE